MFDKARDGDARILDMVLNRIDGKVPDILVGGLGFGALEDVPGEMLDKIIEAGERVKKGMKG